MTVPASWLAASWPSGARAVMTTRDGGVSSGRYASFNVGIAVGDEAASVAGNRARFAEAIGASPVFLRQVHGSRVVRVVAADARVDAPTHEADASVTTEPGIACVVQAADCLPVLFAASNGRAVAAAHAGWRGLAAGVLEAAVEAVCEAAGCAAADVNAWLGACIGPRAFEVGDDVVHAFASSPGAARNRFKPVRSGKWLADLPGLARDRLALTGVTHVEGGQWCTVEDASSFFSFRRDGVTGRMAAAVWIGRSVDRGHGTGRAAA